MRKFRLMLLAFFMAFIMIFGCFPIGVVAQGEGEAVTYRAKWAQSKLDAKFVWLYTGVNGSSSIANPNLYPQDFTVVQVADGWYYVTSEEWGELETSRYVKSDAIELLLPVRAQIGTFDAIADCDSLPSDAVMQMSIISPENYDPEVANYIDLTRISQLLGAYDIKIMQGENEWQPAEGESVKLSLNAASWGLYTGASVYIVHVHENTDGTKSYQTIGPVKVNKGRVDFEVNGFSNFYVFNKVGFDSCSIPENGEENHYYVEPGAKLTFPDSLTWTAPNQTHGITLSGTTVSIPENVSIGVEVTYTVTWTTTSSGICGGTTTNKADITIHVVSRDTATEKSLEENIGIFIRQPDAGTADYPSEPGLTGGTYYTVLPEGNGTSGYYIANDGRFPNDAGNYLNPNIVNSPAWMYDPSGSEIGGIVDATGKYSLDAFKINGVETIDWKKVALAIAEYNASTQNPVEVRFLQARSDGKTFDVTTVTLVNDPTKTLDSIRNANGGTVPANSQIYYEEFELIPYVIKLMSDGWHVDVAVIHEESYLLGYDLNLGEGYTTTNKLVLPSAQILLANPETHMVDVSPGGISGLQPIDGFDNSIQVVERSTGLTGVFQFKGWFTSATAQSTDILTQPGGTLTITGDTTLYAIWEYVDGNLEIETGVISIFKMVSLAPGSPYGAKIPTAKDSGFAEFIFEISFTLSEEHLRNITFDANKRNKMTDVTEAKSGTIAGVLAGTESYDFLTYTKQGDTYTFTIKLGDGENFHFAEVPIDSLSDAGDDPDVYTVKETIPQNANRYSTAGPTEITHTMSVTTDVQFNFENYYTPPVTGLEVTASGGDEGEVFVYVLTSTSIQDFSPIRFAVPANESVIITGLLEGNYKVTEVTDWNYLWGADANEKTVTLTSSGNGEVEFNHSSNGNKWIFGHSYVKKKVS